MITPSLDFVLAITTASCAVWLIRQPDGMRRYASLGMALMAVAAGLGSVRYAGFESIVRPHTVASQLAGAVSLANFALVAVLVTRGGKRWIAEVGLGVLLGGWAVFVAVLKLEAYRTVVGTVAILIMVGVAASTAGRSLAAAAALAIGGLGVAIAGLGIGTEGALGPLAAIDAFHVVLAGSHLLMAYGLVHLPEPVEPG